MFHPTENICTIFKIERKLYWYNFNTFVYLLINIIAHNKLIITLIGKKMLNKNNNV